MFELRRSKLEYTYKKIIYTNRPVTAMYIHACMCA